MKTITGLPRRNWRSDEEACVKELTSLLRQPSGTQTLHPIQAVSLKEIWECEGAFVAARVGAGKTLISGLAMTLLASKGYHNPMLIVPASLRKKTQIEFAAARQHWQVGHQYLLRSYRSISQMKNAEMLAQLQPDVLVFDEFDPLRRFKQSAVGKRISRYIARRREQGLPLACIFLGATPQRDSIKDFCHMVRWALPRGAPVPVFDIDVENCSRFIDDEDYCYKPEFVKFYGACGDVKHGRAKFREQLIGTPGIIVSDDKFESCTLSCTVHVEEPGLDDAFKMLRQDFQRPDGWDLVNERKDDERPDEVNTMGVWGVARQLALGFFYKPDPMPPEEWMRARRGWLSYVRDAIDAGSYDTELEVRTACIDGATRVPELDAWLRVKDTFAPNKTPLWLSTHALDFALDWGKQSPGVIWVDHVAFGHKLSEVSGWHYYGQMGLNAAGQSIEQASPHRPVIASRAANYKGRNLQYQFHRNLIMAMPTAALELEQMIGRTHRYGQTAENVHVDIYAACREHLNALDKVAYGAESTEDNWGLSQKWFDLGIETVTNSKKASWAWR